MLMVKSSAPSQVQPITFSSLFGQHVPSSLVECIQDLLRYDPQARLTTQQCLDHPYFRDVAPRLLPPQAKPPAPPSAPSPIRRVPDRMAIDSSSSPMRSIPPSHSQMSASSGKPVFGANSDMQTLPPLRRAQAQNGQSPPHRVPFYQSTNAGPTVQMRDQSEPPSNAGSPMHESSDVQWAPAPAPAMRDSTISQYPAFPDSASMYAGSHASMQFDDRSGHGSNDTSTLYDGSVFEGTPQLHGSSSTLHLQDQRQSGHGQQQHHSGPISPSPSRTVYDDDMTLALERERQGHATDGRNQGMGQYPQGVGSSPNLPSMRDSTSDVSLSNRNDQNASNETVNSKDKDKRRSRGWGLHISSVFSGSNNSNSNSNGSGSNTHNHNHNHSHSSLKRSQSSSTGGASVKGEQTPAQQVVAAHMEASAASAAAAAASAAPAPPMDPKKAKKEAEKAAREAEKAKREAQQKAARERARAVMQKRNQLLAASNNKDEVEWLNTSLLEQPAGAKPYPSEKARGKQPMPQNAQTQYSGMSSGEYPRHSQGSHPDMPYSPSFQQGGNMVGSPSMMSNRAFQHRGTHETRLGRTKARRREFDDDHSMSSFGEEMDPRRISMQSYQTGDSDPGPGKSHLPGHPNYLHRTNSASSLNSAPSLVDPSRFTTSLDSQRSSAETRSISSLDHQLITNMENMTAAEARSRSPGNISPGPIHLVGSRQSVSRQSRGSRASSANRQGSASPLHHQGAPRYHPYSHMAGQPSMSSTQSSSAHSHYNFTLPPLQSIHGATNPDGSSAPTSARSLGVHQQRGISRGSLGSNPTSESSHLPPIANAQPPSPYQQQQMVNPIFQVPSPAGGGGGALAGGAGGGYAHAHAHAHPHLHSPKNPHQPTLPPFSQLAAAADIPLPPSASPTQHVFRRHSPQPGPQGTYDNGRMYGDGNASG